MFLLVLELVAKFQCCTAFPDKLGGLIVIHLHVENSNIILIKDNNSPVSSNANNKITFICLHILKTVSVECHKTQNA